MKDTSTLSIKPIVHYPSEVQLGKSYLMTIDIYSDEKFEWQYEREEYSIYCKVNSENFDSKPIGEPVIILHRYGGSYGKAIFLMTAKLEEGEGESKISITLTNSWGIQISNIKLTSRFLSSHDNNQSLRRKTNVGVDDNKNEQANSSEPIFADILAEIIRRQSKVVNFLELHEWESDLVKLQERTLSRKFRILFLGEFKRGKSTLINALIAREIRDQILPADILPCTACITEVKWGELPHAILHYQSGGPESVSIEQLKEHVLTNLENTSPNTSVYRKFEVFLPLSSLRSGLEIIDSPGLNDATYRQEHVLSYLNDADIIFFVMSALSPLSQSELEVINEIYNRSHQNIRIVCNHFDNVRDAEKSRLKEYILDRMRDFGVEEVFCVSARDALNGRLNGNRDQTERSGILVLEQEIGKLRSSSEKLKLNQISSLLKRSCQDAKNAISERKAHLYRDSRELNLQVEEVQKQVKFINVHRNDLSQRLFALRENFIDRVTSETSRFLSKMVNDIDGWVESYDVREPLHTRFLLLLGNSTSVQRIASEVSNYLNQKIEDEFLKWVENDLQPVIVKYSERIGHELNAFTNDLNSEMGQTERELVSIDLSFVRYTRAITSSSLSMQMLGAVSSLAAYAGLIHPDSSLISRTIEVALDIIYLTTERVKRIKSTVGSQFKQEISSSRHKNSRLIATTIADQISSELMAMTESMFSSEINAAHKRASHLKEIKEVELGRSMAQFDEFNIQIENILQELEEIELQIDS